MAKVIDSSYQPLKKEVAKAEEEMEKIQIKDEAAEFDCEFCGSRWSSSWVDLVSSSLVVISPDCRHTQAIVKEIGVECQTVTKAKSSSVNQTEPSFCGCNRYQTANSPLGISQLAVTVRNNGHYLVERKSSWWR